MSTILIPIVALMIPMVIVPTTLILKHAARKRELDHIERMRGMELGCSPPPSSMGSPAALAASAIGVLVPLGSFAITLAAAESNAGPDEIWFAPVVVSLAALVASWMIYARGIASQLAWQASQQPASLAKPAFDPDAYDVVGSRG